jgi:hypothetical protein
MVVVRIGFGGADTTWEGAMHLIRVFCGSPLVSCARIAGNISRAQRQRLISIMSMIGVLIASIGMVLIAASATGATG